MQEIRRVKKKYMDFIADLPDGDMHPASYALFDTDPLDWMVSRDRGLRAAMLNNDNELADQLVEDVAHVLGKQKAEIWKLQTRRSLYREVSNADH